MRGRKKQWNWHGASFRLGDEESKILQLLLNDAPEDGLPSRIEAPPSEGWHLRRDLGNTGANRPAKSLYDKKIIDAKRLRTTIGNSKRTPWAYALKQNKTTLKAIWLHCIDREYKGFTHTHKRFMYSKYYHRSAQYVREMILNFATALGMQETGLTSLNNPEARQNPYTRTAEDNWVASEHSQLVLMMPELFRQYLTDKQSFEKSASHLRSLFKDEEELGFKFIKLVASLQDAMNVGDNEQVNQFAQARWFINLGYFLATVRNQEYIQVFSELDEAGVDWRDKYTRWKNKTDPQYQEISNKLKKQSKKEVKVGKRRWR